MSMPSWALEAGARFTERVQEACERGVHPRVTLLQMVQAARLLEAQDAELSSRMIWVLEQLAARNGIDLSCDSELVH